MKFLNLLLSDYGFFDDTYTLAGKGYNGEDRMSWLQFLVMGSLFVLIVVISIFLRRVKREKVFLIYKILAIFMPINEIIKITYSSYFDIINGEPFNWAGILPLYTCSMLMYFLPFVAWGKETSKMRKYSMAFFTTIGLVAGLSNFVYLSAAGFYPIFSYGGLYSVIYHAVIVFVGMSLMITGIYMPKDYKSINQALIPIFIFGGLVLPLNYIIMAASGQGWADYMMLKDVNGFSPFAEWSNWLAQYHLRFLFSFFVLLVLYPLATAIITYLDIGVGWLVNFFSGLFKKNKVQTVEASATNETVENTEPNEKDQN